MIPIPESATNIRTAMPMGSNAALVLAAIVTVMRDLGLPPLHGEVTFYPNRFAFESAIAAEAINDLKLIEKQFDVKARRETEQNFSSTAAQLWAGAGKYRKVLINESIFYDNAWSETLRVYVLAHELTHTAQWELIEGRFAYWDSWLFEGFAEWVASKVLDGLDILSYAKRYKADVDEAIKARDYQTFPTLSQLALIKDWDTWGRTLGTAATYRHAFLAVDYLIEEKGLPKVLDYFRGFLKDNDRQRNFVTAFGEPLSAFEEKFSKHLQGLTKN